MRLTKNFYLSEFIINQEKEFYNLPFNVQNDMIQYFTIIARKLEVFREFIKNTAIIITSGFRSISYNTKVGGKSRSFHLFGFAVDIVFNTAYYSLKTFQKLKELFGTVIYYPDQLFYHVDIRSLYGYTPFTSLNGA